MSVIVPTVERGLLAMVFCSIEITGREAEHEVDVGLGDLGDEALGEGRERLHDSGAVLRRRWCRTPGSTSRNPTAR